MGCDPEFFFVDNSGKTTGAEKVLPEKGLQYNPYNSTRADEMSNIVIDGVQSELNPRPGACRANLGNEIAACFRVLQKTLAAKGSINVSFEPVVKLSREELHSLSEKSKVFGCAPSTNIYQQAESQIRVNPKRYLKRSAGGHIHLGDGGSKKINKALTNFDVMVPILDIIVGNTCVLLDRDPSNKERRKNYGRVGEYRPKSYGLEYRTLSNFWLRSYQLMSFVMGLARFAVHVVAQTDETNPEKNYTKAFFDAVKREDIINAIQNNDFALAYSNFLKIEHLIVELAAENNYDYPLNKTNIKAFHWFVSKGINHWFDKDSLKHWINMSEGHGIGWESFMGGPKVTRDMSASRTKVEAIEATLSSIKANRAETEKELKLQLRKLKALEGDAKVKPVKVEAPEVLATVAPAMAPAMANVPHAVA